MFFQIIFIVGCSTSVLGNFYEILGVSRSATDFDIKNSYKKLARQWHPDKNKSPGANDHFTKINEAYEALSNPEKRREYDAFGSISNEPRNQGNHQSHFWSGGSFGNAYFDFGESDQTESNFESTNYRHYKIDILPNSIKQPTLILLVSHFCFSCHHAMKLWNNIAKQITESGIRIALADVMSDAYLREELQIQHVPTVVMIIDGRVRFLQSEINKETVIDFIRHSFPIYLVQSIQSEDDLNDFHNSWVKDSRSKMIMTKPLDRPSFRFLSMAFKYREKVSAGFVHLDDNDDQCQQIIRDYNLRINQETVIVFHDDKYISDDNRVLPKRKDYKSEVRLTLSDIDNLIKSNYLMPLTRLLSQSTFDQACPPPSQRQRSPGFCAILIIDSQYRDNLSESFTWRTVRSLVNEDVRMVYLFQDVQQQFLESLRLMGPDKKPVTSLTDQVIMLWRNSYSSATTLVLPQPWQQSTLEIFIRSLDLLSDRDQAHSLYGFGSPITGDTETLSELIDELAPPIWLKICSMLIGYVGQTYSYIYDTVTEPVSLIVAVIAIVLVSYAFATVKAIVRHVSIDTEDKHPLPLDSHTFWSGSPALTDLLYKTLLERPMPGRLVCVYLRSSDSPTYVSRHLFDCITKLNNPQLVSATLDVDDHPMWLKGLCDLMATEEDRRSSLSSISGLSTATATNHGGIVLALNIGRCYLSICPVNLLWQDRCPVPPTTDASAGRTVPGPGLHTAKRRATVALDLEDSTATSDSSSCCSSAEDVTVAAWSTINGQSRLFDWLCQLTEGSCRRYYVTKWPATLQ